MQHSGHEAKCHKAKSHGVSSSLRRCLGGSGADWGTLAESSDDITCPESGPPGSGVPGEIKVPRIEVPGAAEARKRHCGHELCGPPSPTVLPGVSWVGGQGQAGEGWERQCAPFPWENTGHLRAGGS